MRQTLLVLATLFAAATGASAQQLGPHYSYGMTEAEVRAASPTIAWGAQEANGYGAFIATPTFVTVGTQSYMPIVELEDGRVVTVRYGRPMIVENREACTAAAAETVVDLERDGTFNGERTPWESPGEAASTTTGGGSVLRSYAADEYGESMDFANRRGPVLVEVQGSFAMRPMPSGQMVPGCIVSIRYALDPFVPTPPIANAPTAAELDAAELITGARFIEQPDGSDYAQHYPAFAMERNVEARVTMNCIISANGRLRCAVESEEPLGLGFGAATQRIMPKFRVAPQSEAGESTEGRRIRRTIVFRLAN